MFEKNVEEKTSGKVQVEVYFGSQVVTSTLEAMGANTTVLAWSEAYQALQQVIEGVEVHLSAAVGSSMQEVTKYLTFTGHQQLLTALVISESWFKSLPDEYKTILQEASYEAGFQEQNRIFDESLCNINLAEGIKELLWNGSGRGMPENEV